MFSSYRYMFIYNTYVFRAASRLKKYLKNNQNDLRSLYDQIISCLLINYVQMVIGKSPHHKLRNPGEKLRNGMKR